MGTRFGRLVALGLVAGSTFGGLGIPSSAAAEPAAPLHWSACAGDGLPEEARCATLAVPVDWARPHGRRITVELAKLPATGGANRIGTVLVVPGGPGGSGVRDLAQSAGSFAGLRQRFDVVGLAPRTRADRPALPPGCYRNGPWVSWPDNPAEYAALGWKLRAGDAECRQADPELFDHLDSGSVARDMDAVRTALGERHLNLLANSYGGVPAVAYARRFPERVRTLYFDGTGDPTATPGETDPINYRLSEDRFRRFIDWCRTETTCALHGADVSAVWRTLVTEADRVPVPATGEPPEVAYTGFDFVLAAGNAVKNPGRWPLLAEAIDLARRGDAARFVGMLRNGLGHPKFPAIPFARAVECADDAGYAGYREHQQATVRGRQLSAHLPGYSQLRPLMCAGWPRPVANPIGPLPAHRLPPLMVADQALDYPSTASLIQRVPGSAGVRYEGTGHGLYLAGQPCVISHADRYFVDRVVPPAGASCPP